MPEQLPGEYQLHSADTEGSAFSAFGGFYTRIEAML